MIKHKQKMKKFLFTLNRYDLITIIILSINFLCAIKIVFILYNDSDFSYEIRPLLVFLKKIN